MQFVEKLKSAFWQTGVKEKLSSIRYKHQSYSQFGEDVHLASFFTRLSYGKKVDITRGIFVDVGAYRPIALSNSYTFYRKGWKCINIDATPGSMKLFNKVRPRDINLEVAIGAENCDATYFMFGSPSVFNTLSEETAKEVTEKFGLLPTKVPIKMRRLSTILDEHVGDSQVEILNVDAEGLDVEILRSNDFSRHRPRVILIETHGVNVDNIASRAVVSFLAQADYHLFSWINPNLMFVRSDSLID